MGSTLILTLYCWWVSSSVGFTGDGSGWRCNINGAF